jgi:hypothetical protein
MADIINLGSKDRQNTERRIAELALAGLQRSAYAGVFRMVSPPKTAAWICDLQLDGYNRQLEFKVWCQRLRTSTDDERHHYQGRLSGLRPFFQRCDFDLFAPASNASDQCLIGHIDLHIAMLSMSVLVCKGADGTKRRLGLLEVARTP